MTISQKQRTAVPSRSTGPEEQVMDAREMTPEERAELRRLAPEMADMSGPDLAGLVGRYPSMFAPLANGIPSATARAEAALRDPVRDAQLACRFPRMTAPTPPGADPRYPTMQRAH
jgi:hypothetical protein